MKAMGIFYEYDKRKIAELDYAENYFDFLFSLQNILERNTDLMPKEKVYLPFLKEEISNYLE